jgi:hypothetical protein
MDDGESLGRESIMSRLEQVMCTATPHTTRGRYGAARSEQRSCHFATWEQPGLFAGELRAAFKSLR